jgi:prepilin-type N-terminal cleavage/methylation domain-containing protein
MNIFRKKEHNGFTLIELMVTISIIGLLSLMIFSSFATARKRARATQRVSHLKQVQSALEYYYAVNRTYPTTGGSMRSQCAIGGSLTANNVIPNLVPIYLQTMPSDPQMDAPGNNNCYVYISNGTDYAFLDYNVTELGVSNGAPNYNSYPELIDPARDGGVSNSIVDGSSPTAWKVSSQGGRSL